MESSMETLEGRKLDTETLRKIFDDMDKNHNGAIDDEEIRIAMEKIGSPVSQTYSIEKYSGLS